MPDRYRGVRDWAHWARELIALGHQVRLLSPSYVMAYLKRGKNDVADAEAICEAVTRPSMHFVPVKSEVQHLFPLGNGLPPPTPCRFPGARIVVLDLTVAQRHPEPQTHFRNEVTDTRPCRRAQ